MHTHRTLSRRRTLIHLGLGGLGATLAAGGLSARAQDGTPVVLPPTVPPELEAWAAGWEAQDPAQIASAYAEDAVVRVMAFGTVLEGVAAIEEYFTAYFGAFEASTATIITVFATEEQGGAEWLFEGQYTGHLPDLPAGEGQPVVVRGASILTLDDGQIVQENIYTDLAGLLAQIGVVELTLPGVSPPATPAG